MSRYISIGCCVVQGLLVAAVLFLPIGFDHKSSIGLDFTFIMFAGFWYVRATIVGLVAAGLGKHSGIVLVQLGIMLALFGGMVAKSAIEAARPIESIEVDIDGSVIPHRADGSVIYDPPCPP